MATASSRQGGSRAHRWVPTVILDTAQAPEPGKAERSAVPGPFRRACLYETILEKLVALVSFGGALMMHLGKGEIESFLTVRLDAAERQRVLHHLGGCSPCRRRLR